MEEKIIEARFTQNKLSKIIMWASLGVIALGLILTINEYLTGNIYAYSYFHNKTMKQSYSSYYDSFFEFFFWEGRLSEAIGNGHLFGYINHIGILGVLVSLFLSWEMSRCELLVTNKRVTGKASFRKVVDLPINQISAVGLGLCRRISVATSSGRIHFWFIENREEVYSALIDILGKVQPEKAEKDSAPVLSDADELRKFRELLDSGVITQEEFDAKKKQLLGL